MKLTNKIICVTAILATAATSQSASGQEEYGLWLAGIEYAQQQDGTDTIGVLITDEEKKKDATDDKNDKKKALDATLSKSLYREALRSYFYANDNKLRYDESLGRYVSDPESNRQQQALLTWLAATQDQPSKFWIGVQCEPAEKFTAKIPDFGSITVEGGLKINGVSEDSPASEGNVEEGDILFKCNGKVIFDLPQLRSVINESGENPIKCLFVRDGKVQNVTLTPAERPKEDLTEESSDLLPQSDDVRWFYDLSVPNATNSIPEGYEATIQLKSNTSPTIVFRKGDDTWLVKKGKYSKLPKEVQEFASSLVAKLEPKTDRAAVLDRTIANNWPIHYRYSLTQTKDSPVWRFVRDGVKQGDKQKSELEKKVDSLQQQMNELMKVMNELKK